VTDGPGRTLVTCSNRRSDFGLGGAGQRCVISSSGPDEWMGHCTQGGMHGTCVFLTLVNIAGMLPDCHGQGGVSNITNF